MGIRIIFIITTCILLTHCIYSQKPSHCFVIGGGLSYLSTKSTDVLISSEYPSQKLVLFSKLLSALNLEYKCRLDKRIASPFFSLGTTTRGFKYNLFDTKTDDLISPLKYRRIELKSSQGVEIKLNKLSKFDIISITSINQSILLNEKFESIYEEEDRNPFNQFLIGYEFGIGFNHNEWGLSLNYLGDFRPLSIEPFQNTSRLNSVMTKFEYFF